jgi:hypothetical protein
MYGENTKVSLSVNIKSVQNTESFYFHESYFTYYVISAKRGLFFREKKATLSRQFGSKFLCVRENPGMHFSPSMIHICISVRTIYIQTYKCIYVHIYVYIFTSMCVYYLCIRMLSTAPIRHI